VPKSTTPETGLRPAPVNLLTPVPKALGQAVGEVGEFIGKLGQVIYQRAKELDAKAIKMGAEEGLTDYINIESQYAQRLELAETPEEKLNVIKERNEWVATYKDWSDLSALDEEKLGYFGRRLKKLGWTPEALFEYQIKLQKVRNQYDEYFAKAAAQNIKTLKVQLYQTRKNIEKYNMLHIYKEDGSGSSLNTAINKIIDQESPHREQHIQELTTTFIDAVSGRIGTPEERPYDAKILEDVIKGVYDNKFVDADILKYHDKAKKALEEKQITDIITEKQNAYFDNPQEVTNQIRKDKSISVEAQDKIISALEKRLNQYEENKTRAKLNDKDRIAVLEKEGKRQEALNFLRNSPNFTPAEKTKEEKDILEGKYIIPRRDEKVFADIFEAVDKVTTEKDLLKIKRQIRNALERGEIDRDDEKFFNDEIINIKKPEIRAMWQEVDKYIDSMITRPDAFKSMPVIPEIGIARSKAKKEIREIVNRAKSEDISDILNTNDPNSEINKIVNKYFISVQEYGQKFKDYLKRQTKPETIEEYERRKYGSERFKDYFKHQTKPETIEEYERRKHESEAQ